MLHSSIAECGHAARIGEALDSVGQEWFSHVLQVPLIKTDALVPVEAMPTRLEALGAEMAQQREAPFDYAAEVAHAKSGGSTDAAPWRAMLHGNNATAGVVCDTTSALVPKYSVVVRTNAGPVGRDFAKFVRGNPQLTVSALRATPEYRVARSYSMRNAQRIAANIAGAMMNDLSYPVSTVCGPAAVCVDHAAAPGSAPQLLAVPTAHTRFNDFAESPTLSDSRNALYIGCLATAAPGSSAVLRHRDHIKGFSLTPCDRVPVSASLGATAPAVWNVAQHVQVESNPTYVSEMNSHAAAANWRAVLRRVYKDAATGRAINPATADALWRTSEHQSERHSSATTMLTPVAMLL